MAYKQDRAFQTLQDPYPKCGGKTRWYYVSAKSNKSLCYLYSLWCKDEENCGWWGINYYRLDDDTFYSSEDRDGYMRRIHDDYHAAEKSYTCNLCQEAQQ
jgi:hypothetical protein